MSNIDFYFDFMSPYSYLAHCRLPELAEKYGYTITYKPIDLKAAKLAAGNTAPPTAQIPPKLRYAFADLARWGKKYGATFKFGKGGPTSSARCNKGVFYAIDRGQAREYVHRFWLATYGEGWDFDGDDTLTSVAKEMGWSPEEFLAYVQSDEADRRYEEGNKEAQARGVFGVPLYIVDDEMWWGNDRLDMLEEYLAEHPAR